LSYKLSEVQDISLGEEAGAPVIILKMKYVRYVLVLDDDVKRKELIALLGGNIFQKQGTTKSPVKLPRFYSGG
jgi:hypothetical protein